MSAKSRLALLAGMSLVLLSLIGCGGSFIENEISPIVAETVSVQMQYLDGAELGPLYDVEVMVPADWVNQFETRNVGNKLYFTYLADDGVPAEIFYIEALSVSQYWDQNGPHPGSYTNIVNRGDTFFIYYLPIDSYYSGLDKTQFTVFAEKVPAIVASFNATVAN